VHKIFSTLLPAVVFASATTVSLVGQPVPEHRQSVKTLPNASPPGVAQAQKTPRELQQFVCNLYDADKQKAEAMTLDELPLIGGWFSIQLYRELLSPSALLRQRRTKTASENLITPRESLSWSQVGLPKVAPNPPPIPPPDPTIDWEVLLQRAHIWRDWIQANEATLKTLQPTGEGVDVSGNTCSKTQAIPLRVVTKPR
jgi:hypothetical protein